MVLSRKETGSIASSKSLWLFNFSPIKLLFIFSFSALLSWCHLHDNSSSLISKINNLLDAVGHCEEYVLKHLKSITPQPHVVDLLDSIQDMDLCHVSPTEKKIYEAEDERLCENNAEFNKICSNSLSGVDCSSLECCGTQEHTHSENPSLPWILEQTASLVKQLGVSVDILQHLKQLWKLSSLFWWK